MNTARKESSGPTHKRAEDVPRCGALSLLQKPLHYKGGLSRNRAQLLCMWPLVVRCMHMAVVPRPMPAAISARYRRRRYQQLTCACGTKSRRGALADARGATQVLDRGVQAVARGATRCASQDPGAHADARSATHVLGRGVQAVARGAVRCALHARGRSAKTDAYGRSFAVFSTQVSTGGFCLKHNRLIRGRVL
jgi:hypothetical protein